VDDAVLETFRARATNSGKGYQTLINEILRRETEDDAPLTEKILRRVLREELRVA
jgi:hypothetical protein